MSISVSILEGGRITPQLLAQFRAVALGHSTEYPRHRVLSSLSHIAPQNAHDILVAVGDNLEEPSRTRHIVVTLLARLKSPEAVSDLKRYAIDPDPSIAATATLALGRIANQDVLPLLEKIKESTNAILKERAVFSAGLIAHRFNLSGYELPRLSSFSYLESPSHGFETRIRVISRENVNQVKNDLAEYDCPLEPSVDAWQIECKGQTQVMALHASTLMRWQSGHIANAKSYVGQMALLNESTGKYSPGLIILSTPLSANSIEIGIYRTDGTIIWGGEGLVRGSSFNFEIRAVDRPGAFALLTKGTYSATGLKSQTTVSEKITRPKKSPQTC